MNTEKDLELARVNLQVQAEHVARLLNLSSRMTSRGADPRAVEEKLELVETLLWKHHKKLVQLQMRAQSVVNAA
jgi:hypothetical protein